VDGQVRAASLDPSDILHADPESLRENALRPAEVAAKLRDPRSNIARNPIWVLTPHPKIGPAGASFRNQLVG